MAPLLRQHRGRVGVDAGLYEVRKSGAERHPETLKPGAWAGLVIHDVVFVGNINYRTFYE
jgi:hypothetical protein